MKIEKTIRPVRDASKCFYWSLKVDDLLIKDGEVENQLDAREQVEGALKEYMAVRTP